MKSLLIAITLGVMFISQSGFAPIPNVTPKVLVSFENHFKKVSNVKWSQVGALYKADFLMNGLQCCSFYNADGEFVATGRKLDLAQFPLSLQVDLQNRYGDYQFSDSFEINNEEESSLYVTAEKGKRKLILVGHPNGSWTTYKIINRK